MNIERFAQKVRDLIKDKHKGDVEAQVQSLDDMLAGDGSIIADWKRFEEVSKSTMKEMMDTIIDKYIEICERNKDEDDRLYKSACVSGYRIAIMSMMATVCLARACVDTTDDSEADMKKIGAIVNELEETLPAITASALKKMNAAVN